MLHAIGEYEDLWPDSGLTRGLSSHGLNVLLCCVVARSVRTVMGGDVRLPTLTAEGNEMLKVEEISGRGRGLVARTALKAGMHAYTPSDDMVCKHASLASLTCAPCAGTVVAVCDPLVAVPSMEWRHHSCAWCFTTNDHKRLPCKCDGQCSLTRYCSTDCAQV